MKLVDLTGKKFGKLSVIKRAPDLRRGVPRWECKCSCGKHTISFGADLVNGRTKSCGCARFEKVTIDLTGQTFGRLTVIKRAGSDKHGRPKWKCQCSCGNTVIVVGRNLRTKNSKSCGCLRNEHIKKLKFTHGKCNSPEYLSWAGMIKRCNNPNNKSFKDYGGRGLKIYPQWKKSFSDFYKYIGPKPTPKHTIERINNNLGYFPGNIRWATTKEQNNNRRSNHDITFNNQTMNLTQWAATLGIKRSTLNSRIVIMGWPIEDAFCKPIRHHK